MILISSMLGTIEKSFEFAEIKHFQYIHSPFSPLIFNTQHTRCKIQDLVLKTASCTHQLPSQLVIYAFSLFPLPYTHIHTHKQTHTEREPITVQHLHARNSTSHYHFISSHPISAFPSIHSFIHLCSIPLSVSYHTIRLSFHKKK